MAEVQQLTGQHHGVAARLDGAVRSARNGGASWSQIGWTAGLSKQGARQRWGIDRLTAARA